MTNYNHLNALELRLHNEKTRLHVARNDAERQLRGVWIAQIQREIAQERAKLGLVPLAAPVDDMPLTDAELLAALKGN